jgi:glycosyltransferase involved in cell wall biosynthesis
MRIGFDVSQTGALKAGCGFFADSLVRALAEIDGRNEYILYPAFGTGFWDPQHARSTRRIGQGNFERGPEGMSHEECIALWRNGGGALEARLGRPALVHANNYYCPRGLRARVVYTLYDLVALDHPDFITEANRLICAEGLLEASVGADMLVAISEATRRRFLELFPHYPPSRVRTVHPASRFEPGGRVDGLPDGLAPAAYWLTVGTLEPRKNLRRLARAYALLARESREAFPLVIAGGAGWLEDGFESLVEQLGIAGRVRMLGYVEDQVLAALYTHCFAFVYPSLAEGFGLPVLEAMSLGAAVVTSDRSSLPEVVAEAGLTVDPEDEQALAAAMRTLVRGPEVRVRLREAGQARARCFSWRAAAEAVLSLYEEALARPAYAEEAAAKVARDDASRRPSSAGRL